MSEPFFSIIIPTFNRSELVCRAIKSVLNSTFDDYEIIVVDDGSSDGTSQAIQSMGSSKVTYLLINHSGGPARPRNIGISNSNGRWICFLDSDDLFSPQKLERLYYHITRHNEVDIFYHRLKCLSSLHTLGRDFDFHSRAAFCNLLIGNPIPLSATCVSKRFFLESGTLFNEHKEFVALEDWVCWLSAFIFGCRFMFLDEELGQYNDLSNDSISKNCDHFVKVKAAVQPYLHNLSRSQSLVVDEYWDFLIMRSRLRVRCKYALISRKSVKFFLACGIEAIATLRHPLSIAVTLQRILRAI